MAVHIEQNNNGIRLRFQTNGRRYQLTPIRGGKFDNPDDLKRARMIADRIESDIAHGCFDPTLFSYKPHKPGELQRLIKQSQVEVIQIKETEKKQQQLQYFDLKELWEKYVTFKAPSVSQATLEIDFNRRIGKTLAQLPTLNLWESVKIRDWLVANKPPTQAKKILTQLNAATDWGVESDLLDRNPLKGMGKRIKVPPKSEDDDIDPFNSEERDLIIETFKSHKYYSYYTNLVRFLFFTGCRPSEALGLVWNDVSKDKICFNKSYVNGIKSDRLKTQSKRTIRLNQQVKNIIADIRKFQSENPKPNPYSLVFFAFDGNYLDWHNFANRAWRKILDSLPDISYRNPYQTRHTFITLAIKAGASYADIAKHCGNSAKIILDRYAGVSRDFIMPEL